MNTLTTRVFDGDKIGDLPARHSVHNIVKVWALRATETGDVTGILRARTELLARHGFDLTTFDSGTITLATTEVMGETFSVEFILD